MAVTSQTLPAATVSPRRRRTAGATRWWLFLPLALVVLVAVLGQLFTPYDPTGIVGVPASPPSAEHWFGLDANGMDVFSRVAAATGVNLFIAATATVLATLAGVLLGLATGANESGRGARGGAARALARSLDVLDAIPSVVVGLVLVALVGPSTWTIIVALALIALPRQAKLTRAEVFRTRTEAYVDTARQAGDDEISVMFRTILPNSLGPVLENMSAVFGLSIIVSAALGFLGVGLPPPTPEWGTMIATGSADTLNLRWWSATFPTAALMFTVISVALASSEILRRRR
jgi:peptide/nickel transport system permease protein